MNKNTAARNMKQQVKFILGHLTFIHLGNRQCLEKKKEMSVHHYIVLPRSSQKITASLPKVVLFTAFTANWLSHKNFVSQELNLVGSLLDKTNLLSSLPKIPLGHTRPRELSISSCCFFQKCIIIAKPNMHFGLK